MSKHFFKYCFWSVLFLFIFIISLYTQSNPDEAPWAYQASLVIDGQVPNFDFNTHEPYLLLLIYGAMFEVFSQSQEALRMLTAILIFVTALSIYGLVNRYRGSFWAGTALWLFLTNMGYMGNVIGLHSMNIVYAAEVVLLAALLLIRQEGLWKYCLIGLILGISIGSRWASGTIALVVVAYAPWASVRAGLGWQRGLLHVFAAAAVSLPWLIPDALILLRDPARVWFERITVAHYFNPLPKEDFFYWASLSLKSILKYFIFQSRFYAYYNLPIGIGLLIAAGVWLRHRKSANRHDLFPVELTWAWVMLAFVVTPYLATPGLIGWLHYLNTATPFLIVIMTVSLGGVIDLQCPEWSRRLKAAFIIAILPFSLIGFADLNLQVLRRHSAGAEQKLTIAGMGCWLEIATNRDDRILDFWSMPVVIAQRKLPRGLEKSGIHFLSYSLTPDQRGLGLDLTEAQLLQQVEDQSVAIINDGHLLRRNFPTLEQEFLRALGENYTFIGTYGGENVPNRIYASKRWLASRTAPLPPLPREHDNAIHPWKIKNSGFGAYLKAWLSDAERSVQTLPTDLRASFDRLFGASWERRCRFVMDGEGRPDEDIEVR